MFECYNMYNVLQKNLNPETEQNVHHHLSLRRKLIIMGSVMASLFLVALDQTIVSTALGSIVTDFNAYDSLGWVVTAYLLTTTVTVPIAGKLSDIFGRRLLLLVGVAIFAIASLFSGLSTDMLQLVLWRAVQGIGGGIITANAFTIVGDLFAARERGRWQGLIGAVFGLSSLVGPLLGGWLTDGHGLFGITTDWRWTFFINVPIAIVAFVLIAIYCPALRGTHKQRIDYLGASLLTVALAVLILSVDNTENIFAGLLDVTGWSLLTLRMIMWGIVALSTAGFIWAEHRASEPIIPLSFFKNRNFVLLTIVSILFGAAFMGSILFLTQFNQQVFNATPTESGLMLLPMVGGIMLSSILSGQIISRIGTYRWFLRTGFVVGTVSMLFLTFLTPESGYLYEAIVMSALGLGMGVALPVINLAIQNEFSQRQLGVATSSNQLFRSLGSTVGTAVFGALLTAGIAGSVMTIQQTPYVDRLSASPAVAQIGSLDNPNTLLTLNMSSDRVLAEVETQTKALPPAAAEKVLQEVKDEQVVFADAVEEAFSSSVHSIFVVSTVLMAGATVLVFAVRERRLAPASPEDAPGVL